MNNAAWNRKEPSTFQSVLSSQSSDVGFGHDLGASYLVNQVQRPFSQRMKNNYALYQNTWEGRKIVNILVFDLLRNGWKYQGLEQEEIKKIERFSEHLQVINHFKEALRLERLVGGSVIFLGVSDGATSPKEPLDFNQMEQGSLRFINTISRTKVSEVSLDKDPLSSAYGHPQIY